jgi:cutinase
LSVAVVERVAAVVLFGDPDKGKPFTPPLDAREITFCHAEDLICDGLPIVHDEHRNYEKNAPQAAAFVKEMLELMRLAELE